MGLELAKAYVTVRADASHLGTDFDGIRVTAVRKLSALGASIIGMITGAIAGLGYGAWQLMQDSVREAERAEASFARLEAVIKATGGAAGFSAKQMSDYASELQSATTVGDDEIMESMAVLATFKSVTGDVFKRATAAALDVSATGFGSVESAAIQLGKALEDPVRGMGALRRVGVSFTAEQEEQIKILVKTNQLLGAQAIVLEAVEGQVKGTAEALATTNSGRRKQLANILGDQKEMLGFQLIPLYNEFSELQVAVGNSFLEASAGAKDFQDSITLLAAGLRGLRDTYIEIDEFLRSTGIGGISMFAKLWAQQMNSNVQAVRYFVVNSISLLMTMKDAWNAIWSDETIAQALAKHTKRLAKLNADLAGIQSGRNIARPNAPNEMPGAQGGGPVVPAAGQMQVEAGRSGFAEYGKMLQDMALKTERNPNEKLEQLTEKQVKNGEETNRLLREGNRTPSPAILQ